VTRAVTASRWVLTLPAIAALAACQSVSPPSPPSAALPPPVPTALRVAEAQVGAPYRYGGASPAGFDCSGLVHYSFGLAGIPVPRTAASQQRAAAPVALGALEPGDLVFFRINGGTTDHVGIYAGRGHFVHAPSSGGVVGYALLSDPFFAPRVAGAGRFDGAVVAE
jgi:cell wall-associated NlpC family hydrolase